MIVGNKNDFAIEAVVEKKVDDWVFGRIRFWIAGYEIGDWNDSADLKGCVQWLLDFVSNPHDWFHQDLYSSSTAEFFRIIFGEENASEEDDDDYEEVIENAYGRFNISHLGMSSFEKYDCFLVKNEMGAERVVWRSVGDPKLYEAIFPPNTLESVALSFCGEFKLEIVQ